MTPKETTGINLIIHETAEISRDARIIPSVRETKIVIGANTHIYEFVVIKAVVAMGMSS
jgi:UDP-3-O-[3-hydroxymyristoyl] glucosamine N-acyltransferase